MADKRGVFVPLPISAADAGKGPVVNLTGDDWALVPNGAGRESQPTGLYQGGELNITGGGLSIEVVAGIGAIIDSYTDPNAAPVQRPIEWSLIDEVIAFPFSDFQVHMSIQDSGNPGPTPLFNLGVLVQRNTRPTPAQIRDEIYLGYAQSDLTSVWQDISTPVVINNNAHTLVEFVNDIAGPFFIVDGGDVSEVSPAFTLDFSEGTIWQQNRNWHVNRKDPNREIISASTPINFRSTTSDGLIVSGLTTVMDPSQYENPLGTLTAVGGASKNTTVQRLYVDASDNFWLLWGQNIYDNFLEAIGQIGIDTESTEIPNFLGADSVLLGYIVCERTESDWVDEMSQFVPVTSAAAGGGGGVPVSTYAGLTDTPSSYTGEARKAQVVNDTEDGLIHENRNDWKGAWAAGTYHEGQQVEDQFWLMIANKTTTDRAAPQAGGVDEWISELAGVPAGFATLTNPGTFLTGNRFTIGADGAVLNGYRWYVPEVTGNFTYEVWIADSGGTLQQLIAPTTPVTVGWVEIPSSGLLLPGTIFDLMVVVRSVAQPNNFASNWDVKNENTNNPSSGEAIFRNNAVEIRVHHIDKNSVNQQTTLEAITVGGTLSFGGDTWTITAINQQANSVRYGIEPNQGRPTEAEYLLQFSWGSAEPVSFVVDAGHYAAFPQVTGFADTTYPPAVQNANFYGVDVNIEEFIASPDWDFQAFSSGGGSGGGGATTEFFTDLLDTPASYSGSGGTGLRVKGDETGLEYVNIINNFLDLPDTPSQYSGFANQTVKVNADADALEFVDVGGGGGGFLFVQASVFNPTTRINVLYQPSVGVWTDITQIKLNVTGLDAGKTYEIRPLLTLTIYTNGTLAESKYRLTYAGVASANGVEVQVVNNTSSDRVIPSVPGAQQFTGVTSVQIGVEVNRTNFLGGNGFFVEFATILANVYEVL